MAPTDTTSLLGKRYYCNSSYYGYNNNCSAWSYYGRWIFAAIVIVVILAICFLWACVNSRRRRRRGAQPMYGTGWMAGNQGQNQNNPNAYYNNSQQPPPAYGAGQSYPMQNQNYNSQQGYYGQREGVAQAKDTPAGEYAPPPGPPPAKIH
ncbi:chitin synthesis regulation, resistance to congo red-domain-containing protein [Truncatella angustata]|uniref:Chitin synthesis regulation, resistance to congo red-domain-containing protein n=1 Tax=Truncatella angustata TaxID=152316 RepID=A0A9P9A2Z9_9PEZI|nr:chitin synthesis regulation, resistance to congo red-domain-containing protein [Truncatella angustata]KAH6659942.1 chitin synthesis regulation, resistance to congo red-domain-containing protein [Truncatella angustata]